MNFAVKNLEIRMAGVEQKLNKMAIKSDVEALEQRVLEIGHELAEIKARL